MPNRSTALVFIMIFSVLLYPIIIGIMYGWLKLVHSPLRLYQRKMLTFFAIFLAAVPVLNPLWIASAWWLTSLKTSVTITIILFLIWGYISFAIVRKMSLAGHCLSEEQE